MNTDSTRTDYALGDDARFWTRVRRYAKQHVRYEVIGLIFLVMTVNLADRAALSITSTPMSAELHLNHLQLGWIFSSFAWAYVLFQVAGGWALDRFGAKRTYLVAIVVWSLSTAGVGLAPYLGSQFAYAAIFVLIFMVGMAAAPTYPANSKIVSAWFPTTERGTATAIFNATQYFAAAVFTPLLAILATHLGWRSVFFAMGAIGIVAAILFAYRLHSPLDHPRLTADEREFLRHSGATFEMDGRNADSAVRIAALAQRRPWTMRAQTLRKLLCNRLMLGVSIAQYCIATLSFFFLMWFPVYLVQQRHLPLLHAGLLASIPAICGFTGGILGGLTSDMLLRRGYSLSFARKLPIYIGMSITTLIVACNYVSQDWMIVVLMALAFFGKGYGALGWTVITDTSPINAAGLNASVFNTFNSLAGITSPIAIGYIVHTTHSFNGALVFVAAHAVLAIVCYALVAGTIRRLDPV